MGEKPKNIEGVEFGPYSYHSWPVRMNPLEHEGRSVWEHCPIPKGTSITLAIQNLPPMLCSIGFSEARREDPNGTPLGVQDNGQFGWINKPIVRTGPFFVSRAPITVGCELWVIPSWQLQLLSQLAALPAPTNDSLEGVDVRPLQGHEVDRLQLWAAVSPASGDLIEVTAWLRHPSGIWAEADPSPVGGPPPVVTSRVFDVRVRDADRVYLSFNFVGPVSGLPVFIAFGVMTAPIKAAQREDVHIRFGAVVSPYQ